MHTTLTSLVAHERIRDMRREAERARRPWRSTGPVRRAGRRHWTPLTLLRRGHVHA